MNFLALLGWNPGTEQEFFTPEQFIQSFSLERIGKSGAHFDETKLLHLNREWMRTCTDTAYLELLGGDLAQEIILPLVPLLKERAHTFAQARAMLEGELSFVFSAPSLDRTALTAKESESDTGYTKIALTRVRELFVQTGNFTLESLKEACMTLAHTEEETGKGRRGNMLWALRYALTGMEQSPDPFTVATLLGKDESLSRIDVALGIL